MRASVRNVFVCVFLATVVLIGACGGGGESSPPQADPPTTPPTTEVPVEEADLDAWEDVVAGFSEDGEVSKEMALQAFELTIADLPGVDAPDETVPVHSATAALRWVTQYQDELTPEQGDAVEAALAPVGPDGEPLEGDESGADDQAATGYEVRLASTGGHSTRLAAAGLVESSCTVAQTADEDAEGTESYRAIVDQEIANVEQRMGMTLGIPVHLALGLAKGDTLAAASPQSTDCSDTLATSCRVTLMINTLGGGVSDQKLRSTIAHEIVHCLQARMLPPAQSLDQPEWITEGFADFVGEELHPGGPRNHFKIYELTLTNQLFNRVYDAEGFFFHLMTAGGDPWGRYQQAFAQPKDQQLTAFKILIDGVGSDFDDTWASAYAREPERGSEWDEPEAPLVDQSFPSTALENGEQIDWRAAAAQNKVERLEVESDVVRFDVTGSKHGRIGWDGENDALLSSLEGQDYCNLPGGCECPDVGPPEPPAIPAGTALVALSGTTTLTIMQIQGLSLEDYCGKPTVKAKATPLGSGIDPCVVGTWESSDWVMPGPIPGMDASGGAGAKVTISSDGRLAAEFDGMAPLAMHDDQLDLTYEMASAGTATAQLGASGGTWDVSDPDFSGLQGTLSDSITGDKPIEGGPGVFVGLSDGSYTCQGDLVSYSTPDPVENRTVSVTLHKSR